MKFPILTGEIVIVKTDQKQARKCYVESLKVTPYTPMKEPCKLYSPTRGSNSQVMSVVEEFPIKTLTIYETNRGSQDNTFDVDPWDDAINKGPKPIKELIKLQLGPKLGQCTQLSRDLTNCNYKNIVEVLRRNIDLFA